jgi:hypothetical protein
MAKRFCVIAGHGFQVGLNFENEENEKILINKIGNVWKYYTNDFKIMFSGFGEIKLYGPDDNKTKVYTSVDFNDWLTEIAELKESTFNFQQKNKQIYMSELKKNPLQKAMYKKLIERVETEIENDKKFIDNLRLLRDDIRKYSI